MNQRDSDARPRPISKARRDAAIDALSRGFADDHLGLDEFEARVGQAIEARTEDELQRLLADLPATPAVPAVRGPAPAPRAATDVTPPPRTRPADPERDERRQYVVAIMSGAVRKGHWEPSRHIFSYAFWGGAELDFREAVLPPGTTTVTAIAVMGGIDIIVPPGVGVDVEGFALMGGVEQLHESGAPDDPDAPRIRVQGFAMMGGVDVSVRRAGESKREAARRRKAERRARRNRP